MKARECLANMPLYKHKSLQDYEYGSFLFIFWRSVMQGAINRCIQILRRRSRSRKYVDLVLGDQDLSELAKGSGIALFFKIISLPMGLLTSLIISRRYGAEAMGIYGLMTTVMGIIVSIGLLGLGSAMPRFLGEARAKQTNDQQSIYRTAVRLIFVSGLMLSPLLYFIAPWLSEVVFHEPKLLLSLQVGSLFVIPIAFYRFNIVYLLAEKKIYCSELITKVIIPMCMLLIVFISYWIWPTYYIPVWAYLLTGVGGMVASLYFLYRYKYASIVGKLFDWRNLIKVSGPMLITGMAGMVISYTDVLMLGFLGTVEQVGVYKVLQSLVSFILIGFSFIGPIAGPKVAEMYRTNKKQKLSSFLKVCTWCVSIFALFVFCVLIISPDYILSFWGDSFLIGSTALVILSFAKLFYSICGFNEIYMNATGRQNLLQRIFIIAAIINAILNYFFIPMWGLIGATLSSFISIIFWNAYINWWIWKKDGIILSFSL